MGKSFEEILDELPPERRERVLAEGERLCAEYRETLKNKRGW